MNSCTLSEIYLKYFVKIINSLEWEIANFKKIFYSSKATANITHWNEYNNFVQIDYTSRMIKEFLDILDRQVNTCPSVYSVTGYMEQSLSWGTNSRSASREIPCSLWQPKFYYHSHKSPPLVPVPVTVDSFLLRQVYLTVKPYYIIRLQMAFSVDTTLQTSLRKNL